MMLFNYLFDKKIMSWAAAAAYLDNHPEIQSYSLGSHGSIGYVLMRTQLKGIYHQLKYDGSRLVWSSLMDTANNKITINIV